MLMDKPKSNFSEGTAIKEDMGVILLYNLVIPAINLIKLQVEKLPELCLKRCVYDATFYTIVNGFIFPRPTLSLP